MAHLLPKRFEGGRPRIGRPVCVLVLAGTLGLSSLAAAGPPATRPAAAKPAPESHDAKAARRRRQLHTVTGGEKALGFFLNPQYAIDHKIDFSEASGWRKAGSVLSNVGLLLAGVAASAAVHEISHFVMAKALGVDFDWPAGGLDGPFLPLWRIGETSSAKRVAVALSGFASSAVAAEVILLVPQIPKDNLFVLGFLMHAALNNLLYPITDLVRGGYGDMQVLREANVNLAYVHVPLILHSLLALIRLTIFDDDFSRRFNAWATPTKGGSSLQLVLRW